MKHWGRMWLVILAVALAACSSDESSDEPAIVCSVTELNCTCMPGDEHVDPGETAASTCGNFECCAVVDFPSEPNTCMCLNKIAGFGYTSCEHWVTSEFKDRDYAANVVPSCPSSQ